MVEQGLWRERREGFKLQCFKALAQAFKLSVNSKELPSSLQGTSALANALRCAQVGQGATAGVLASQVKPAQQRSLVPHRYNFFYELAEWPEDMLEVGSRRSRVDTVAGDDCPCS